MERKNWLPEFSTLLGMKQSTIEATMQCKGTQFHVNQLVIRNSLPTNKAYATLLCGNMITHIVDELNEDKDDLNYRFEINPVVSREPDRHNKLSDYSIFKIKNKKTLVIIEVKLGVPHLLVGSMKDDFAQLCLEALYCSMNEGEGREPRQMLCILTNGMMWHALVVDLRIPITFLKYYCIQLDGDYKRFAILYLITS